MRLSERSRKLILLGVIGCIVVGIITANMLAKDQDNRFANEDLLYEQSKILIDVENYDEASHVITTLLKDQPSSEAANYLGGIIATNIGDMQYAAGLFQKTLDLNPYRVEDPVFMLNFGQALYNENRYDDAKVVLTRCLVAGWEPANLPNYQEIVRELINSIENMQ